MLIQSGKENRKKRNPGIVDLSAVGGWGERGHREKVTENVGKNLICCSDGEGAKLS